jgi:hypothetical protein
MRQIQIPPIKRTIKKVQVNYKPDEERRFRNEERRKRKEEEEKITQIRNVLQGFYPNDKYQNYVLNRGSSEMKFTNEGLADTNFLLFMYDTCIAVFNNLDAFNIVFEEIAADILNENPIFLREALRAGIDVCGNLKKIIHHYSTTNYDFYPEIKPRVEVLLTKFEKLHTDVCVLSKTSETSGSEAGSAFGGKKRHAMNKQTKKRRSKKRTSTRRRQRKNIRK